MVFCTTLSHVRRCPNSSAGVDFKGKPNESGAAILSVILSFSIILFPTLLAEFVCLCVAKHQELIPKTAGSKKKESDQP